MLDSAWLRVVQSEDNERVVLDPYRRPKSTMNKQTLIDLLCSADIDNLERAQALALDHGEDLERIIAEHGYNEVGIFKKADFLAEQMDCSGRQIRSLPAVLPAGLKHLNCSDNQLTVLPSPLPGGLKALYCGKNLLSALPELPEGLEELDCSENQIVALPNYLPEELTELDCSNNQLTSLVEYLSNRVVFLDCRNNRITRLPDLHNWLEELAASGNLFDCVEGLPPGCTSDLPACKG